MTAPIPQEPSRVWPRVHMIGATAATFALLWRAPDLPDPVAYAGFGLIAWSLFLHVRGRSDDIKTIAEVAREVVKR